MVTGLFLFITLALSCSQQEKKPEAQQEKQQEARKDYIPVTDFIRDEIKKTDSLPVGILKRVIKGNTSDSVFITPKEFHRLATEFLPGDLDKETFERSFNETSFLDQTTEMFTFTYQSKDASLAVKRVDVLMPIGQEVGQIKTVYIEKSYSRGDTAINQKLLWKAGSNFSIITSKGIPGKQEEIQQMKVIWDPLNY